MNYQQAIFILATTLSFFSSKAQIVDSLNTNSLINKTSSVKDTVNQFPSAILNASITRDTITDSLQVVDSTLINSDSTSSLIIDSLIRDTTNVKRTKITVVDTSSEAVTSVDSLFQKTNLLLDSSQTHQHLIIDSVAVKIDSLQNSTIVKKDTIGSENETTNDSLQSKTIVKSDSITPISLEKNTLESDTSKTVLIIDSILAKTPLYSISINSKDSTIENTSSLTDTSTSTSTTSIDNIKDTTHSITKDTLVKTIQAESVTIMDSLLPIDGYDIIELDTLHEIAEDTTTIELVDTASFPQKSKNSVNAASKPYEKLTGDALVDSIMNASMVEIQNTPKPKTKAIAPSSLESYSVDDLPSEISFVVHAFDSSLKTPIKATVLMTTLDNSGKRNNGTGICNSLGYFSFFLTPHSHFEITVSFPDYIPIVEEIDFTNTPAFTPIIKKEYALKKLQVGDVIHLKDVNFKQGDFHLQREAFPVLDKLAKMMLDNPKMVIKLKGHTDNSGSPSANIILSKSRITEVRYYLLRKGIKLNRLKGEGYGGGHPLVPNNSPENMQKNRRVEFEVLKI